MTQTLLAGLHEAYRASVELYIGEDLKSRITKERFPNVHHSIVETGLNDLLCEQMDTFRKTILLTKAENASDALLQITHVFCELSDLVNQEDMSKEVGARLELIAKGLSSAALTLAKTQGAQPGEPGEWECMRTRVVPPLPD